MNESDAYLFGERGNADVVARLRQVCGEAAPAGVATPRLVHAGPESMYRRIQPMYASSVRSL